MAPSSSSTRKAARLAQKGKGKRVRFQGGTLFPMVVAIVLVAGLALIVYARTSRPAADASAPRVYTGQTGDHWHGAYGFQICSDTPNIQLSGDLESRDTNGALISAPFASTGIHSHDDGVIHWHAWSARASGRRAQIGVFFDNYDIDLSNDKLELPAGPDDNRLSQLIFPSGAPDNPEDYPLTYEEGETECAGEDATLKVVVWENYLDPNSDSTYTSDFGDIPFDKDGLVVVVAFVADDVDVEMPSWAADLERLGAVDGGNVAATADSLPETTTGGTTETTAVDGTEPDGTGTSETTEAAADDTAADTTDEPTSATTDAASDTTTQD